jgi:hypothetical protein
MKKSEKTGLGIVSVTNSLKVIDLLVLFANIELAFVSFKVWP